MHNRFTAALAQIVEIKCAKKLRKRREYVFFSVDEIFRMRHDRLSSRVHGTIR